MALLDIIKKGSTDRSVTLKVLDSTTGLPDTATYDQAGIDLWYRRQGGAVVSITEATLATLETAHTDGGFLVIGDGEHRLDAPDAAFATGANYVDFGGTATDMVFIGGRVKLVDYDPEDATNLGLSDIGDMREAAFVVLKGGISNVDSQTAPIGSVGPPQNIANALFLFYDSDDSTALGSAEGSWTGSTKTMNLSSTPQFELSVSDTFTMIVLGSPGSEVTLADGAITAAKIDSDAITAEKIADDAITSAKIADGAIAAAKIGADAITAAKIADDAFTADHFADASITDDAISSTKLNKTLKADQIYKSSDSDDSGTFDNVVFEEVNP